MKKQATITAITLTLALGVFSLAGCAQGAPKEDINANVPAGAPSLMPKSHEGRFESLGANGCFGCHGASERSNPMLKDATVVPEDHYLEGSSTTYTFDPVREQCNTCHAQG